MNQALLQFNASESRKRKVQGMSLAAQHRKAILEDTRQALKLIALSRPSRIANADDAALWLAGRGINPQVLGNAAGSLFAGPDWKWTGGFTKSVRVQSHNNLLRIWKYIGR